jgi:hypothetical protein
MKLTDRTVHFMSNMKQETPQFWNLYFGGVTDTDRPPNSIFFEDDFYFSLFKVVGVKRRSPEVNSSMTTSKGNKAEPRRQPPATFSSWRHYVLQENVLKVWECLVTSTSDVRSNYNLACPSVWVWNQCPIVNQSICRVALVFYFLFWGIWLVT